MTTRVPGDPESDQEVIYPLLTRLDRKIAEFDGECEEIVCSPETMMALLAEDAHARQAPLAVPVWQRVMLRGPERWVVDLHQHGDWMVLV